MESFLFLSVLSYLIGSLSFGHIVARLKNIDLTKIGSKSSTATNVARALGWKWGAIVAVLDFAKGFVGASLASSLLNESWQIIIVAILPTIGHIFPIFFGFKGGKGGASFLGACLGLVGLKYFIPTLLAWFLLLALFEMTSVANLLFPWLFSVFLYFVFPQYLAFGMAEGFILSFALRKNIKRLINKEEPKTLFKM